MDREIRRWCRCRRGRFRADRARQISHALLDDGFDKFKVKKNIFANALCFTQYSEELNKFYEVLFKPVKVENSLPEILEKNNLTQARIAETEKYAHVTFFFSGGREDEFEGESRILVQSPKVPTYDLQPEMSAPLVKDAIVPKLRNGEADFVCLNFACFTLIDIIK